MSENQLSRRSLLPAPFAEQLCWLARAQVTSPGCPGPVFTTPITQRETLPVLLCSTLVKGIPSLMSPSSFRGTSHTLHHLPSLPQRQGIGVGQ